MSNNNLTTLAARAGITVPAIEAILTEYANYSYKFEDITALGEAHITDSEFEILQEYRCILTVKIGSFVSINTFHFSFTQYGLEIFPVGLRELLAGGTSRFRHLQTPNESRSRGSYSF